MTANCFQCADHTLVLSACVCVSQMSLVTQDKKKKSKKRKNPDGDDGRGKCRSDQRRRQRVRAALQAAAAAAAAAATAAAAAADDGSDSDATIPYDFPDHKDVGTAKEDDAETDVEDEEAYGIFRVFTTASITVQAGPAFFEVIQRNMMQNWDLSGLYVRVVSHDAVHVTECSRPNKNVQLTGVDYRALINGLEKCHGCSKSASTSLVFLDKLQFHAVMAAANAAVAIGTTTTTVANGAEHVKRPAAAAAAAAAAADDDATADIALPVLK